MNIPKPIKLKASALHVATYNPRSISNKMMEHLKASIVEHGLVVPFVVQATADDGAPNVLIAGHQRLAALKAVCGTEALPDVYAVVVDVPDRVAKRMNISLNKIDGEFDVDILGKVFTELQHDFGDISWIGTGFEAADISSLLCKEMPMPTIDDVSIDDLGGSMKPTLTFVFDDPEQKSRVVNVVEKLMVQRKLSKGGVLELLCKECSSQLWDAAPAKRTSRSKITVVKVENAEKKAKAKK